LPGLMDMDTLFSCFLKQAHKGRVAGLAQSTPSHRPW